MLDGIHQFPVSEPGVQAGYKSNRIGLSAACISCARLLAAQTYTTVRRKQLLKLFQKNSGWNIVFQPLFCDAGYSWCGLPAELYPHGAETLDFTGFPRYLLLRCEDEIAGCFAGDLLSQVSYTITCRG